MKYVLFLFLILSLVVTGYTKIKKQPVRFRYIVIHHTADGRPLRKSWKRWWMRYPSYNFGITKDAELVEGRPLTVRGAHCIADKYPYTNVDMNWHSIGIVLEGDYEEEHATPEQLEVLYQIVSKMCKEYKIPFDKKHIIPHMEASFTLCPGHIYEDFWNYIEQQKIADPKSK